MLADPTTRTRLTRDSVVDLMTRCLLDVDETGADELRVEGETCVHSFHRDRVKQAKPEIVILLSQLPLASWAAPNGVSILALQEGLAGQRWGGTADVDALVCLGLAVGCARFTVPRAHWSRLAGRRPFVKVL